MKVTWQVTVGAMVLLLSGCTTHDYEIHLFMDRETEEVTGYIIIDDTKHSIRGEYAD